MFARISRFRTDNTDRLVEGFEPIRERIEATEGLQQGLLLVDRDGGKAMSITLFDSEEAMTASTEKADALRKEGADAGGGSIESVETFEVAMTVGKHATV